jgi:hypothetical protein
MFFPCTTGETVLVNGKPKKHGMEDRKSELPNQSLHTTKDSVNDSIDLTMYDDIESEKEPIKTHDYLTKPTVIMCNPNALVY